jgi:hypothetical protein
VRLRVGTQIVHPSRIDGSARERADDDHLAVDAEIGQRRHPALAGLGARRGEQQQVGVGELSGDLSTVGPELLDEVLVEGLQD